MKLENNTILITGGTSGIGLGLAQKLSEMNNTVIVTGRNQARIDEAVKDSSLVGHQMDVADPESVRQAGKWIQQEYPELNIVINSAGIMRPYSLFDEGVSIENLLAEINTNLSGTIAVDKTLLNHLVAQKEALIVNVSSGLANLSSAAHPVYSATKAGVHMFTDALREQLAFTGHDNVHVMELVPPLVAETNLEPGANTDIPNNLSLTDLVAAAIEGMESDQIRVNAGYAATLRQLGQTNPDEAEHQMALQMLPNYFSDGLEK